MLGTCQSWVYNRATRECFLKKDYDESRNTIPCATCVAYHESSEDYVYQEKKLEEIVIEPQAAKWTSELFGGDWARWTGTQQCRFAVGHDYPKAPNLFDRPLFLDAAFKCCNACLQEPSTP